ncbi:acetylglutamate kinase [Acetobacterium paludosum]|uniref:Acetylglutamate kinase n=1 Tax=Acetobacterium paludosum TaxID=52693 RepID=A0A923I4Y4_9FIRM|nr:acetylglutamate kinase [Acetobacterium paludosum]MBC3889095.1 acetylglutamate kinase [Acetobacterium paludosum]
MEKYIEKANVLIEALPYIQKFKKKTMVIKYGGSFMYDEAIKQSVMDDIALMRLVGIRVILIHGGGKDISSMLSDLDIETEFVDGLRITNEKVVEVAEMVLSGKINKEIVQLLQNREISAVGLSGKDGGMIKVKKKFVNNLDIGFVGEIEKVDSRILSTLLKDDYLPVIAPIGTDETGQSYNINADHVAYAIAKAVKAEKLIYLTDTDGVYMDFENPDSIIRRLSADSVPKLIEEGVISGGMIPKVQNSVDAINGGVNSVHILDGKVQHSLLLELFTAAGVGTMIRRSII